MKRNQEELPKLKRGLSNKKLLEIITGPYELYSLEMKDAAWKRLKGRGLDINYFLEIIQDIRSSCYAPPCLDDEDKMIYRKLLKQIEKVDVVSLLIFIETQFGSTTDKKELEGMERFSGLVLKKC